MFDDFKIQMSKIWSKLTLFGFKACMVTAIVPEQCCWLYPLGEFEKNHWVQSISHILIISNVTLHKVALGVGSMSLFLLKRHISVRNFEVLISEAMQGRLIWKFNFLWSLHWLFFNIRYLESKCDQMRPYWLYLCVKKNIYISGKIFLKNNWDLQGNLMGSSLQMFYIYTNFYKQ